MSESESLSLKLSDACFPLTVAIDGPSGAGKSTQSRRLATALDVAYLDTGAMYRAVAVACRMRGVVCDDKDAAAKVASSMDLVMSTDPQKLAVSVGGKDVTDEIREPWVSDVVSDIATNTAIRAELVARQQAIVAAARAVRGIVVEGRDITSVVAPEAEVRILMNASDDARVKRRAQEFAGSDTVDSELLKRTHSQVVGRDEKDSQAASFMTSREGVVDFDTTTRTPDESATALLALVARIVDKR